MSCNANLLAFLIDRDPHTIDELTKLRDQYCKAFQVFDCDDALEIADDDVDAYAAHSFPSNKPQHQGKTWI